MGSNPTSPTNIFNIRFKIMNGLNGELNFSKPLETKKGENVKFLTRLKVSRGLEKFTSPFKPFMILNLMLKMLVPSAGLEPCTHLSKRF